MLPQQQLDELKSFVAVLKAKPDLLHTPELSFFKVWLNSHIGAMNSTKFKFFLSRIT